VHARFAAALGGAIGLAGCQPSLSPVVPAGDAGYQAIAVSPEDAVPATYPLQPGDKLAVNVFQEPDLTVEQAIVDQAGNLDLPLIGATHAAGLDPSGLARAIEAAYGARFLRHPQVSIAVLEAVPYTISVEGEVELPGVYPIQPGQTLLTAMALARSPTDTAALDEVLVFRMIDGRRAGARFDLTEIRSGSAADPVLYPGDVVVVGFNNLRGVYLDFLRSGPLFYVFTYF